MADFPNPPIIEGTAPTDGQVAVYQASTNTWIAATITAVQLTVPQAHEGAVSAPAAVTSGQNATAAAATQSGSYVQADVQTIATLANALQTSYNAAQVDIVALRAEVLALTNALNTLTAALQSAGILHT